MKKCFFIILLAILNIFYCNTPTKTNLEQLISKVPISQLPIGWEETRNADSILYNFDGSSRHPRMYKMPYKLLAAYYPELNNLFKLEDLDIIRDKEEYIWYDSKDKYKYLNSGVYFVARLPVIKKDEEWLIYKTTIGYTAHIKEPDVPIFFLVKVNKEGKVSKTRIIGGLGHSDNDFILQLLFYIDKDYKMYLKYFLQPSGGEYSPFSDKESDKFENPETWNYYYVHPRWETEVIDLKNEK